MNKQIEEYKKEILKLSGQITHFHELIKYEQNGCEHIWIADGYGWYTEKQKCSECEKGRWKECPWASPFVQGDSVQLSSFPVKHKDGWYYA